jgi:hypothetical protein
MTVKGQANDQQHAIRLAFTDLGEFAALKPDQLHPFGAREPVAEAWVLLASAYLLSRLMSRQTCVSKLSRQSLYVSQQ